MKYYHNFTTIKLSFLSQIAFQKASWLSRKLRSKFMKDVNYRRIGKGKPPNLKHHFVHFHMESQSILSLIFLEIWILFSFQKAGAVREGYIFYFNLFQRKKMCFYNPTQLDQPNPTNLTQQPNLTQYSTNHNNWYNNSQKTLEAES